MARRRMLALRWTATVLGLALLGLGLASGLPRVTSDDVVYPPGSPTMGARYDPSGDNIVFRIF